MRQDESVTGPTRRCERLPLSSATKRRLWSESGGYCQNPTCGEFLFTGPNDIDFAQMAHIVAASDDGPRGGPGLTREQRAHHTNIVVLCANCHAIVDGDPDRYPIAKLHQWKARHQDKLAQAFGTPQFADRAHARQFVEPLLAANRAVFEQYGPREDDFSEERAALWRRHVLQAVVPNNATILRVLTQNRSLLRLNERSIADDFGIHVADFDARHLLGEWGAGTQTFPDGMDAIFEDDQ